MSLCPLTRFALVVLVLLLEATSLWAASDEDLQNLGFLTSPDTIVSPARSPRPSSKIAENVTVITSDQIEALNAHTLAEVLNTVSGIQLERTRTPGAPNFFTIDGAANGHIQVYIDGIPQSDLNENLTQLGHIPVQNIDRVEVIKGAASAAWGSALGGVINVITKAPFTQKAVGGSVKSSIGDHLTSDTQAELSGTADRFGYYLSGGYLNSDGLLPHTTTHFVNGYSKFVYELPGDGAVTVGADWRNIRSGAEEFAPFDFRDDSNARYGYTFANLNKRIADQLVLDVLGRWSRQDPESRQGFMSSTALWKDFLSRSVSNGVGIKLLWGGKDANLTTGFEYEHDNVKLAEPVRMIPADNYEKAFDRLGYYANAALTFDKFTLLPGARFDQTGSNGDLPSYTLGATYQLTGDTILRGYWARGYSLPKTFFPHGPQKVWTVQAGLETSEAEFIWVKGTFFYNKTWNIEDVNGTGALTNQIRQGIEVEVKTVPIWDTSFGASYTFSDIRNEDTGQIIPSLPNQVVKLNAFYDNKNLGLSGVLTGNIVNWNRNAGDTTKDRNPVWDLTITKKLSSSENAAEIFFSGHNLFDTPQYLSGIFPNAGRWFEGGVRCRF